MKHPTRTCSGIQIVHPFNLTEHRKENGQQYRQFQFLIQNTKGQAQQIVKSCEYISPDSSVGQATLKM